jgi:hypothetical protein
MSASVGTAQQSLGIGIGRLGSAFFAVVVAVIIAAAVALGQLGATASKPLAPAGGLQNPDAVNQGTNTTITLPESFGGWNGPRVTTPGIDGVDHGARDEVVAPRGGQNGRFAQ